MKNFDFYFYLNLFNILLVVFMFGMFLIFFITCYISPNWILPSCFILLCILAKIFLLYLLFVTFEKFFPNSELIKVVEELKTNSTRRKYSLLLSFGYDAAVALYFAFPLLKEAHFGSLLFFPILWEIYTLGGICMFYISLFLIWKIQDMKIRKTK